MNSKSQLRSLVVLWIFAVIAGCSSMKLEQPVTIRQKIAYAQASLTEATKAVTTALKKKVIDKPTAVTYRNKAKDAQATLDTALEMDKSGGDANNAYKVAEKAINALREILIKNKILTP
ncbi:MAG: hypothetical protein WCK32_03535 [Chlorobiaceae bacterium]